MELGNFSISLNVRNLQASKSFYQTLGFETIGGDESQNWLILQNGDSKIGLFQGMFDSNIMTFNPGWDSRGEALESFTDVREIQSALKSAGVALMSEAEEGSGPASVMLTDPDGNMILIDQHI